ncbi:MAG: TRAP transporter small permease [Candidatus Rokubacteria bacterium]|nr:TRAP transporter small permease [Candidatus Rokubacteria bacterium]
MKGSGEYGRCGVETTAASRKAAAVTSAGRQLLLAVDRIAAGMAFASGAVFLLASVYIVLDVIGRKFVGISSAVTDEMGGYALAFGGMWALAHTLRTGGHVRIDVLLPHLPRTFRIVLSYAALLIMVFFAGIVAVYVWRLAADSYAANARAMSFLRTPLFVPQGLMAFGFSVLSLEAAVIFPLGLVESIAAGHLMEPALGEEAGPAEEEASP